MRRYNKNDLSLTALIQEQFLNDLQKRDYPASNNPFGRIEKVSLQQSLEIDIEVEGQKMINEEQEMNGIYEQWAIDREQSEEMKQQIQNNIPVHWQGEGKEVPEQMVDEIMRILQMPEEIKGVMQEVPEEIPVLREEEMPEVRQQIIVEEQEANDRRYDGNNLSQNISSTVITIVSKLLSKSMGQEVKQMTRSQFNSFLKENGKTNSVISLVFVYLYFLVKEVNTHVYSSFQEEMHKYFVKRRKNAIEKEEHIRNVLIRKIDANNDLLNYLFTLKGAQVNFQAVRGKSEGLLSRSSELNKQTKQLEDQLDQAERIHTTYWRNLIPFNRQHP